MNTEEKKHVSQEKKPQREAQESNAAKASKQIEEFMHKVQGMMTGQGQRRNTETAMSGSNMEESNDDIGRQNCNSFLSHHRGVSKKSMKSEHSSQD